MPDPAMRALYGLTFDWTAVPTMAALICSGFQVGWRAWTRAATPATCGEAIDVPENVSPL